MKYAKTAALVASSVVALGTAAPAFAVTTAPAPGFGLDSGVDQVLAAPPKGVDPIVDTVGGATDSVQKQGAVAKVAGQATGAARSAAPLLGGVSLGG
ncbi:hypothetical protein ACWC9U_10475 [Streptomyces sp. 900116325]